MHTWTHTTHPPPPPPHPVTRPVHTHPHIHTSTYKKRGHTSCVFVNPYALSFSPFPLLLFSSRAVSSAHAHTRTHLKGQDASQDCSLAHTSHRHFLCPAPVCVCARVREKGREEDRGEGKGEKESVHGYTSESEQHTMGVHVCEGGIVRACIRTRVRARAPATH